MTSTYVETDCTFHGYESGGAVVTPDYAIGYVQGRQIVNWHGDKVLGNIVDSVSWPTPNSYVSSRMYQIQAFIDGVRYTGRSGGEGMVWKSKRMIERKQVRLPHA